MLIATITLIISFVRVAVVARMILFIMVIFNDADNNNDTDKDTNNKQQQR